MPRRRDLTSWLPVLLGPDTILIDGTPIGVRRNRINFVGASQEDDRTNDTTNITIASVGGVSLVSTTRTAHTTLVRCGALMIEPPEDAIATFKATIENSTHSTNWAAQVQLYNVDDDEVVTASVLDDSASIARNIATEVTAVLPVGEDEGELKPSARMYAVRLVITGTATLADRAILSNARLEFSF